MNFSDWRSAHRYAQAEANARGYDMSIRKAKEFGETVFVVRGAAWNDSDYALAEIVRPYTAAERAAGVK